VNLDGYDCVLRAYEYLHVHDDPTHLRARNCLEGTVERFPDYAEGWAWLAYLYLEEYHHRRNERPDSYDSMDRALEAARRAVALDPTSQVSHGVLAMAHQLEGNLERRRAAAYEAIDLNPNNALWLALLGSWLSVGGDFEHGVPMTKRALALSPNPLPWLRVSIFLEHYQEGRYEEALAEALVIDMADYRTALFRAATYGQLGQLEKAQRMLSEMREEWAGPVGGIREDLILRNGFAPDLAEQLFAGLAKAGVEDQ
jgi:Tfp pilus assembly protein PilF